MDSNGSAKGRLFKLLDKIIGEERGFRANSRGYRGRLASSRTSSSILTRDNIRPPDTYRQVNERLERVHRQFTSEHELLIQRCLARARQVRAGLLSEAEMAMELERLKDDYRRLKADHRKAEQEGREILRSSEFHHGASRQAR